MKKQHTYSTICTIVLTLIACHDRPSPVAPLSTSGSANIVSHDDLLEGYVPTPAGWYHESCVHQIPVGARVERNNVVKTVAAGSYQLPLCLHPPQSTHFGRPDSTAKNPVASNGSGWTEWTYDNNYTPRRQLVADWTVPAAPSAYATGQVYYTFPALEQASLIVQTVLQYGRTGSDYGGPFWSITSWQCNGGTNCIHSAPITVNPSDLIHGSMVATNCVNHTCTWTITTRDVTTAQETVLTLADYDTYNYVVGGAVETYSLNSCSNFPSPGVSYSNIAEYDSTYTQVTPFWSAAVANDPNKPVCGFRNTFTPTSVLLEHWAPPITGPSRMYYATQCTFTASATGGTAPITYTWSFTSFGGSAGGYSPSNGTFVLVGETPNTNYTINLKVVATDAIGIRSTVTKAVSVDPGANGCG